MLSDPVNINYSLVGKLITFSLLKSVNWWHGEKVLVAGEQNKEMNNSSVHSACCKMDDKIHGCSSRESFFGLLHFSPLNNHQFSSVAQSCPAICDPMNRSTPGLPVHHQLPEFTQTHVHWVGDAIQPSHPLSSPSPPAPNPSQHQGLFQWVNSLHEVAKILEFQLQHQSFQWTTRTDLH